MKGTDWGEWGVTLAIRLEILVGRVGGHRLGKDGCWEPKEEKSSCAQRRAVAPA